MYGDILPSNYTAFTPVQNILPLYYSPYQYYPIIINPFKFGKEIPQKNIKRRRPSKYNKIPKFDFSEDVINESIRDYQNLECKKVVCSKCGNNVELIKSFGQNGKFTCLDCSVKTYSTVGDLPDWEAESEDGISYKACPCQRIKHTKDLSSFIRYNNKSGEYELGQLCIYCRNVKRYEYLRKQSIKRAREDNEMCIDNNAIVQHPIKKVKIEAVSSIN